MRFLLDKARSYCILIMEASAWGRAGWARAPQRLAAIRVKAAWRVVGGLHREARKAVAIWVGCTVPQTLTPSFQGEADGYSLQQPAQLHLLVRC